MFSLLLSALFMVSAGAQESTASSTPGQTKTYNLNASLDMLAPVSLEKKQSSNNYFDIRSAEISIYGAIDQWFDGVFTLAGHSDEGAFEFAVHEGYLSSSRLVPRSRFRVGKFFLGVGRLNQFHQHDWPFVDAPKVHQEFFSEEGEGVSDTGLEYTYLMPTTQFIEVTLGVTNGYCYGHCHDRGEKPIYPLHYVRPSTFFDFGNQSGMVLGLNYMGRSDSEATKTSLFGFDLAWKKREGKTLRWLVQSEVWYQMANFRVEEDTEKFGYYIYPQYGFNENWYFGVRLDGFSNFSQRFETTGLHQRNFDYGVVPTLTYKPSEFATLRLAYSHLVATAQSQGNEEEKVIQLQFAYLLGAHPAHDF